eukprot:364109-Chlamydomonas_euryale.AAC.13
MHARQSPRLMRVAEVCNHADERMKDMWVWPATESVMSAEHVAPSVLGSELDKTLVCFVLVDNAQNHAFVSSYDFGPWPLLQGITSLPPGSGQRLSNTNAMWTNGFVFDELPLDIVVSACQQTVTSGAAVFFDPGTSMLLCLCLLACPECAAVDLLALFLPPAPVLCHSCTQLTATPCVSFCAGPRCFTMLSGERRAALDTLLDWSDVVLMTEVRPMPPCLDTGFEGFNHDNAGMAVVRTADHESHRRQRLIPPFS